MDHTVIAGRKVPIAPGPSTVVYFTGDCHPNDLEGEYEFWLIHDGVSGFTGRRPTGSDPGERFRMMEGVQGYEQAWELAKRATRIYPAPSKAVLNWLKNHPVEAACARACRFKGASFRITTSGDGAYHLIPDDRPANKEF
jgi:hypothetical protein